MPILTRLTALLLFTGVLAGCGDDGAETITAEEWAAAFDEKCVELVTEFSDPATTEAEILEGSAEGIAEMRALPTPETMADEANTLLDVIEATVTDSTLTDAQITALDEQFLAAALAMGISDECLGGSP